MEKQGAILEELLPSPDKLDKYLKRIFCQKNAENNL